MNVSHAIATYRGHTVPHFRIIERRNVWFAISGALIVLSIAGLAFRHLNLSIDFEGGAQITYPLQTQVDTAQITSVLEEHGVTGAEVQIVNGNQVSIRTQSLTELPDSESVLDDLAKQAGVSRSDINVEDIGPTWGSEISRKALRGLLVVLAAIAIYIAIRFEWAMAVGAMIALVHDVLITAGIYALVGREVTPETVIAILTILGFSLYDTVVIYDKIQENTESPALLARYGFVGVIDRSLNQVLMRSVNTSLVVMLPILSLLLFGGETLKDFAFAMFIGTGIGAYSSIFIAAPILTIIKRRDKRTRQLEARRSTRPTRAASATPGPAEEAAAVAATSDVAATGATARTSSGTGTGSRPRPKSKRRPPPKRKRR